MLFLSGMFFPSLASTAHPVSHTPGSFLGFRVGRPLPMVPAYGAHHDTVLFLKSWWDYLITAMISG